MIKIVGHDIWRGADKIAWIEESHIRSHDGQKLGYWSGNDIYNISGRKIGYIEGDDLKTSDGKIIPLENLRAHIQGTAADIARAAVYLLFGE